ncbi:HK97 gp10 family phage protein [Elioraea sp.]|uniref:HK97 gp10 family phage protein n=1 Tax=Elioraea sp. TaxID=2185103 RepID=UPI0025BB1AEC|nr:HK97 gp10 family phage protein [Elioraea sp.]
MAGGLISVRVSDAAPLANVFRRLTPELQRSALQSATFKAANELVKEVKNAAPVGTGPTLRTRRSRGGQVVSADYGRLRDNIRRGRSRRQKGASYVSTGNAFWGAFVEKGWTLTRRLRDGAMRKIKQVAPRPWFDPAVRRAALRTVDILNVEIQKAIEGAARRLGSQVGLDFGTRLRGRRR